MLRRVVAADNGVVQTLRKDGVAGLCSLVILHPPASQTRVDQYLMSSFRESRLAVCLASRPRPHLCKRARVIGGTTSRTAEDQKQTRL
jgi:hypothetical protein